MPPGRHAKRERGRPPGGNDEAIHPKAGRAPVRVILAGGTGFIGGHLTAALLADGHRLAVLTRRAARPPSGDAPEWIHWDPAGDDRSWTAVIEGADAVINLAGENIGRRRWTKRRRAELRSSRLEPTAALVSALGAMPAERRPGTLVSASGIDYYGNRGDEEVDEFEPRRVQLPGTAVHGVGGSGTGGWEVRCPHGGDAYRCRARGRRPDAPTHGAAVPAHGRRAGRQRAPVARLDPPDRHCRPLPAGAGRRRSAWASQRGSPPALSARMSLRG